MQKSLFGFLLVAFFLLPSHAWAAPPCPATQPVYISSGGQILCVETSGTPGRVTVLLTDTSSTFGDIAFGPDGLLYFTDTVGARVFRFDPTSNAASATLVANIPSGTPTGLSFSSSNGTSNGDLYVNSSTGVWLIAGIASSTSPVRPPITPTEAITFTSSITAGGNGFDLFSAGEPETQLIVDQAHNQILQAAFPFTSAKSLTTVASVGPGIFANFCGDALVASGTTIQRLSFSFDKQGNLVVSPSTYGNFGQNNKVHYFEVTADNTVYAATFANGAGGIVWRVAAVKDANGVPSCSAAATTTQLVSLKSALQAKTPPDLASDVANGVAVPPTSLTIVANFDPAHASQTYNFGLHRLIVTYKQVLTQFAQSFTAIRSRPADITFSASSPPTFPTNTNAVHISPLGGFAVQIATPETGAPVAGKQYALSTPGTFDAIQIKSVYSSDDVLLEPGLAHAAGDTLLTAPHTSVTYTDNFTHDFWFADPTDGGSAGGWDSEFVDFNETLKQTLTFTLKSPTASCGSGTTPTCNPQFNIGQNVDFGFKTTPASSNVIARLSIAKVHVAADGTIQIDQTIDVFSKNSNDVDNFFDPTNNTYNWDSSGAAAAGPGLYQATIFSDSFTPQVVFLTLK